MTLCCGCVPWWVGLAFLLSFVGLAGAQEPSRDKTPGPSTPMMDAAVVRALEYLKSAQKPDGAWESGGFGR
ncbi:hypothetical protein ACYOEI_39015, partial [Singulisphaera rosea]